MIVDWFFIGYHRFIDHIQMFELDDQESIEFGFPKPRTKPCQKQWFVQFVEER